jgi:hypothetical protein
MTSVYGATPDAAKPEASKNKAKTGPVC